MKYIRRILLLPFAWVLWTVAYSIRWVKYGGELKLHGKDVDYDPKAMYEEIKRLNNNLEKTKVTDV